MIGDTPYDSEAAYRAGLCTIGVLCGCFAIYRDPADILAGYGESVLSPKPR